MRPEYFAGIFLVLVLALLIGSASATIVYATQGAGETDQGINGVMVPIGIPPAYGYVYTWISLCFLALIAATASQRNGEFWAFLLPVFAAMFVWWGWLKLITPNGDNTSAELGIIIMAGMLALGVYFKGKQQEKFGLAGPGTPFLNIVFWIVMIEASIGFINATGLFNATGNSAVTPLQYQNVDLTTVVPQYAQTGGFFDTVTSDLYIAGAAAFSAMTMIWKVLGAIVNFQSLVYSIAPFLVGVQIVSTFLAVMTVAIDFMIIVALWIWLFKPGIGENV